MRLFAFNTSPFIILKYRVQMPNSIDQVFFFSLVQSLDVGHFFFCACNFPFSFFFFFFFFADMCVHGRHIHLTSFLSSLLDSLLFCRARKDIRVFCQLLKIPFCANTKINTEDYVNHLLHNERRTLLDTSKCSGNDPVCSTIKILKKNILEKICLKNTKQNKTKGRVGLPHSAPRAWCPVRPVRSFFSIYFFRCLRPKGVCAINVTLFFFFLKKKNALSHQSGWVFFF